MTTYILKHGRNTWVGFISTFLILVGIADFGTLFAQTPDKNKTTSQVIKNSESISRPLTEIYKIGAGDVLYINLKNSAHGSGYFTVQADGTIDFPLAGEKIIAAGKTIDIIENILASAIKLFPNPQVEAKVRQYASHRITVSGMVANAGEKSLQREAVPLYVIRAESGVRSQATKVLVTREKMVSVEIYDLREAKIDDVLIYPGNLVEFTDDSGPALSGGGSYFIAGEVVMAGHKNLPYGLTLYQAVIASGGTIGDPKRAIVRRKNDKGLFKNTEHNLRSIRNGKSLDPILLSGDVIEIRN